ncbi:hypothetical protein ACVGXS_12545, partial [Enterobacter hormaechei]
PPPPEFFKSRARFTFLRIFCGGVLFFYNRMFRGFVFGADNVGGVGAKNTPVGWATSWGFFLAVFGLFFLGFLVYLGRFWKKFYLGYGLAPTQKNARWRCA